MSVPAKYATFVTVAGVLFAMLSAGRVTPGSGWLDFAGGVWMCWLANYGAAHLVARTWRKRESERAAEGGHA